MISKQEAKRWIRTVEISDPQKHPQYDFTVYKVKLKYVPVSTMDDEWQVVIYKRYNDFKKLYQTLSTYHKKLQQREPFPELVKANYFDRHEPEVIENRRASAEAVLNFCCRFYHLFIHDSFRLFFEGGLKRIVQLGVSREAPTVAASNDDEESLILNPTSAELMTQQSREDYLNLCTPLSPTPFLMDTRPQLSREDSASVTHDEADDDLAALNNLEKITPPPLITDSDDGGSLSGSEDQVFNDNKAFQEDLFDTAANKTVLRNDSSELDIFDPYKVNSYNEFQASNLEVLSFPEANSRPTPTTTVPELNYGALPDEAYIQQASALVARAQNLETTRNWSEAFTAYKTAVGILLQGVQEDNNVARRADVRAKTALYLEKAEYLHRTYIEADENKDNWTVIDNSVTLTLDADILDLCLPRGHLSRFKVLGLSDNIQLVYEKSSGNSFALKCIRKCPICSHDVKTIVIPAAPYMVRLFHIIETVDCVFLFLEYNTGVLLMDWIKEFTQRDSSGDYFDTSMTLSTVADSRVYEGRSLLTNTLSESNILPEPNHPYSGSKDDEVFKPSLPPTITSTASFSSEESLTANNTHSDSYAALFNTASIQTNTVNSQPHKRALSSDSWGSLKSDRVNFTEVEKDDAAATADPILISQTVPIDSFSIGSFEDEKTDSPTHLVQTEKKGPQLRNSTVVGNRRASFSRQLSSTSQSSKHKCKSLSDDVRSLDGDIHRVPISNSLVPEATVLSRSVESSKPCQRLKDYPLNNDDRKWSDVFDYFNDKQLSQSDPTAPPRIPESCLKQWAAELVTVIDALHKKGLILRDLHRENVLLGPGGHIRLTFFSQWSHSPPGSTSVFSYHLAESNLFVAPELTDCIYEAGPRFACDWWSFGVLLYEMLTSCELSAVHPQGLTSFSKLCLPQWLSCEAADLLNKLLVTNPGERLGSSQLDAEEVKLHPFFSGIDWLTMEQNGLS